MSSAINAAICSLVLSEKTDLIEELKSFLEQKIDDSGEICSLIDEFASSNNQDIVKINIHKKSTSVSSTKKDKKTRTKSYYSHWLSKRLSLYAEENKGNNDKKTRMSLISQEWKEYKETPEFKEKKEMWDARASSDSETEKKQKKSLKKSPKKSKVIIQHDENVSDSESEDEIQLKHPKKKSSPPPLQNTNDSDSDSDSEIEEHAKFIVNNDDSSDDDSSDEEQ